MIQERTRRGFLQLGGVAATVVVAGCRGSPDSNETEQPEQTEAETSETTATETESVSFDFDGSRDSLESAGWKVSPSVEISDSHLVGTDRENNQNDYAMYPSAASGTWSFEGAENNEEFYGIQFILSPQKVDEGTVDGPDLDTARGYVLNVRQNRYGSLRFRKRTYDEQSGEPTATDLHAEAFESSGNPRNYAISMGDSNRYQLSMNGEEIATVTDDTFDINSLVVRFDGAEQRVDRIAYSP